MRSVIPTVLDVAVKAMLLLLGLPVLLLSVIGGLALAPPSMFGWAAIGLIIAALVCPMLHRAPHPPTGWPWHTPAEAAVIVAAATTTGCLLTAGLLVFLGPLTTLALLGSLGIVAPGWWLVRRQLRYTDTRGVEVTQLESTPVSAEPSTSAVETAQTQALPVGQPGAHPLSELTTVVLCRAWRHSYLTLGQSQPGPGRDDIVDLRAHLLDELHRRDPTGFDRWLASGARAASDPARFINVPRDPDDATLPERSPLSGLDRAPHNHRQPGRTCSTQLRRDEPARS